jgi:hypothetical protein
LLTTDTMASNSCFTFKRSTRRDLIGNPWRVLKRIVERSREAITA